MSWAKAGVSVRIAAALALAALTAGCFQPMYAERADGTGLRDKLRTVELPPLKAANASREARLGVEIRNALAFKMYGTATGDAYPTHRLEMSLLSTRSTLMVDQTTALPTSENYVLYASYKLVEVATGKIVVSGSTNSHVSYDMPGQLQRFARARAYRDAEDRACLEIADNLQTRLASYFIAGT